MSYVLSKRTRLTNDVNKDRTLFGRVKIDQGRIVGTVLARFLDFATNACISICTSIMADEKEIRWIGSAYDDLLAFPDDARREAGFQLGRVQSGIEPADWKPFNEVGAGTKEIRIRDASGAYRVMYVAKFEEAIYVLHCFQKKTQATSKQDKAIAETRYRAVAQMRKAEE